MIQDINGLSEFISSNTKVPSNSWRTHRGVRKTKVGPPLKELSAALSNGDFKIITSFNESCMLWNVQTRDGYASVAAYSDGLICIAYRG